MLENLKKVFDIAGTICGIWFLWEAAKTVARKEVEDEIRSSIQTDDPKIKVTKDGDFLKIHIDN